MGEGTQGCAGPHCRCTDFWQESRVACVAAEDALRLIMRTIEDHEIDWHEGAHISLANLTDKVHEMACHGLALDPMHGTERVKP